MNIVCRSNWNGTTMIMPVMVNVSDTNGIIAYDSYIEVLPLTIFTHHIFHFSEQMLDGMYILAINGAPKDDMLLFVVGFIPVVGPMMAIMEKVIDIMFQEIISTIPNYSQGHGVVVEFLEYKGILAMGNVLPQSP